METNRDKYGINPTFFNNEQLADYIQRKTEDLIQVETQLEIAWEELFNRGLSEHK
jgi:hypothetical protein